MKFTRTYRMPSRRLERPNTKFRQRKPRSTRGISIRGAGYRIASQHTTPKPGAGRNSRPRPIGKHWKNKPAFIVRSDKKEVCNPLYGELRWRTFLAWLRQEGLCCFKEYSFCPGELHLNEATFQHERLRGKDRDDRLWDETGPINGAAHGLCNSIAGSRRMRIWHG